MPRSRIGLLTAVIARTPSAVLPWAAGPGAWPPPPPAPRAAWQMALHLVSTRAAVPVTTPPTPRPESGPAAGRRRLAPPATAALAQRSSAHASGGRCPTHGLTWARALARRLSQSVRPAATDDEPPFPVVFDALAAAAAPAKDADGPSLRPGLLVEIERPQAAVGGGRVTRESLGVTPRAGGPPPTAHLGVVLRSDGKRNWVVVDASGRLASLHPRQVAAVLPGEGYRPEDVAPIAAAAAAMAASADGALEIAWGEVTAAGEGGIAPSALAELCFGDDSAAAVAATSLLVATDRCLFSRRQGGGGTWLWAPRPAGDVASLRRSAAVAESKAASTAALVSLLGGVLGPALPRGTVAPAPESSAPKGRAAWMAGEHREAIAALEDYALRGDDCTPAATIAAEALLAAAGRQRTAGAAAALLTRGMVWGPHQNLGLLRAGLGEPFSAEEMAAAAAINAASAASGGPGGSETNASNVSGVTDSGVTAAAATTAAVDADAGTRRDLRGLKVDDAATREVDDALSAEKLESGRWRLWVHIADPSRWVSPGDALDDAARSRGTTMYLPTGVVPMFPWPVAAGAFSLVAGRDCPALSVWATLDDQGGLEPESMGVCASTVRPTYRLTYEDADELMDASPGSRDASPGFEPELSALMAAAESRASWRRSRGAVEIAMPEVDISVTDSESADADVTLSAAPSPPPRSRLLVSELMILAGEVVGALGAKWGLPLPYRGQPVPTLPSAEELDSLPPGPCRMIALRSCMTRSTMGATPSPHAALALAAYVQMTSPIRRYGDLLAHYQLKTYLRTGSPAFAEPEMAAAVAGLGATVSEAGRAVRDTERYWTALYFAQRPRGEVYGALVLRWVRADVGLASILLDDTGVETVAKVTSAHLAPGDAVRVQLVDADPRGDVLRFREA